MNGPFWQEHCFEILDELVARYSLDGVFFNSFLYRPCEAPCQSCDRVLVGLAARLGVPVGDPLVRHTWMAELGIRLADHVERLRPGATVSFDMEVLTDDPRQRTAAGWSRRLWSQQRPVFAIAFDRITRPYPQWLRQAGEDAKYLGTVATDRSPLVHVTYSAIFGNRRAAQPPDQLAHDLIQAAASGAGVGVQIPGTLDQDDRRALGAMHEIYRHLADHEAIYGQASSAARIALVHSQETTDRLLDDDPAGRVVDEQRGWYEALVQGHLPFDVVDDEVLADGDLGRYDVLVLPNVAVMADKTCARVDAFVAAGGGIVATHHTSRRRADGNLRVHFGLQCIGRRFVRDVAAPGSYLRVSDPALAVSLGDTSIIGMGAESPYGGFGPLAFAAPAVPTRAHVGEAELVVTAPLAGATRSCDLHWVPPVRNNIPEFSSLDEPSDVPGLVRGRHGAGRVTYVPWLAGRLVFRYAPPRLALLLADLVRASSERRLDLEVDAPPTVEATLQRIDRGGWLVHLVNATGLHGPGRAIVSVGPVRLRVAGARRAVSLVDGVELPMRDGWHEVARLDRFVALVIE
jgi:hypothetical protein